MGLLAVRPRLGTEVCCRGITVIPSLNGSEKLLVGFHQVGQSVHEDSSLRGGKLLPSRTVKRGAGRLHRFVNIFSTGCLDCSNFFLGPSSQKASICRGQMRSPSQSYRQLDTYAGSIDVIVEPLEDLTNSLLMKRPVGWDHVLPFGAVRGTVRSAMVLNGDPFRAAADVVPIRPEIPRAKIALSRRLDVKDMR